MKQRLEEWNPGCKCFNPNRDNTTLAGGDEHVANGIWLKTWRTMLSHAQRTGGQIETTAKHGGGKNSGLSAAAVEANRLDADTGEGSRAPKPPPSREPP